MNALIMFVALVLVLSTALTWGLRREHNRIDREAAYQLWLETSPALAKVARDFGELKRQIGEATLPSVQRMAVMLIAATAAADAGGHVQADGEGEA